MLRWYNMAGREADVELQLNLAHGQVYRTGILEERTEPLEKSGSSTQQLHLGACEIATLGIQL
ncbi:hypothetical protein D3C73_1398460 [compost metagenome]